MIFKRKGQYHIAWYGWDNPYSGYGSSNLNILKALAKTNVRVYPTADSGDPKEITAEDCAVGVFYCPPVGEWHSILPTPYRIVYTMFEADVWPQEWVEACNAANRVWVPSTFCRDNLLASGCLSPVDVIPLGFDPEVYYPQQHPGNDTIFTFGYAGAGQTRKGFDILLRAFREEFRDTERVRLVIRSSNILTGSVPVDNRIRLLDGICSDAAMREFYGSLDIFVLPTRGEGFGLTPIEAMACGRCAIVTGWSGVTDYLGDWALQVGIDGLESVHGYQGSSGRWATPSVASLRYCMRWAYEHRTEIRAMGMKAAEAVKGWTYDATAKAIEEALGAVNPKERVQIESKNVIVWRGDPREVTIKGVGHFVRGVSRDDLTPEQIGRIDFGDVRIRQERRYTRVTPGSE